MPTSTVPSPRRRIHSCDLVYFRSLGTLLMTWFSRKEGLAIANERRLHDARVEQLAADVDLDALAAGRGHPRQADRAFERRRERAAGQLALAHARGDHFLVAAQHP